MIKNQPETSRNRLVFYLFSEYRIGAGIRGKPYTITSGMKPVV